MTPGDIVDIPDFGKARVLPERMDLNNYSTCPRCKHAGIPWLGWFTCDGDCVGVVAIIGDHPAQGTMFERVPESAT